MPWEHCNQPLKDDMRCPECGISKAAWTVAYDKTRTFQLSSKYDGDPDSQADALHKASEDGTPFCEKCQNGWLEIRLLTPDGLPAKDEKYVVTLPNGEEQEGTLDASGIGVVQGFKPGECQVSFPDRDLSEVERFAVVGGADTGDDDENTA